MIANISHPVPLSTGPLEVHPNGSSLQKQVIPKEQHLLNAQRQDSKSIHCQLECSIFPIKNIQFQIGVTTGKSTAELRRTVHPIKAKCTTNTLARHCCHLFPHRKHNKNASISPIISPREQLPNLSLYTDGWLLIMAYPKSKSERPQSFSTYHVSR